MLSLINLVLKLSSKIVYISDLGSVDIHRPSRVHHDPTQEHPISNPLPPSGLRPPLPRLSECYSVCCAVSLSDQCSTSNGALARRRCIYLLCICTCSSAYHPFRICSWWVCWSLLSVRAFSCRWKIGRVCSTGAEVCPSSVTGSFELWSEGFSEFWRMTYSEWVYVERCQFSAKDSRLTAES